MKSKPPRKTVRAPRVSVIMIFFNEERFLSEAIESVLAQTFDDWQLLLVDDGSTDSSSRIARRFAGELPSRIIYLEHDKHDNCGMSASRNIGIDHAKGEYITFLDADDVMLSRKLQQQVQILDTIAHVDFVYGPALWWHSWTGDSADISRDFVQRLHVPMDSMVGPPALLLSFLQDEWASLHDIMIRRSAVDAVGRYEETFPTMYEDQVFHAKLCLKSRAYLLNSTQYLYRQHSASCTSKAARSGSHESTRRTFLMWLQNYLCEQEGYDPVVLTTVRALIRRQRLDRFRNIIRRVIGLGFRKQ